MPDDDKTIDYLESQIPLLADAAFALARWETLSSGRSVLSAENGMIYETFPDGTRRAVKAIQPPMMIERGAEALIP